MASRLDGQLASSGVGPKDSTARERLASYVVHPPSSLRLVDIDRDDGVVTYRARASSGPTPPSAIRQPFSPLDALAALTAFVPEKEQQILRHYGRHSNKAHRLSGRR